MKEFMVIPQGFAGLPMGEEFISTAENKKNTDTVNRTFSVNLVQSGGSAGNANLIIDDRAVVPGETYLCPELVGQELDAGAFISTIASNATALTLRVSGREIT